MKLIPLCFFIAGCIWSVNGVAKLNHYIYNSNLVASFSAVTDIPEFLKQGDIIKIRTLTPPGTFFYSGVPAYTSGDEWCVSPSAYPYKYEVYKWPETIDLDNLSLSLVNTDAFGIVTDKAPILCSDYQPGGPGSRPRDNWEFVGGGMTATYRVSQVYSAGSATVNTSVSVISGRSEYSPGEIINKLKSLLHCFQSVNVTVTTNVKNWCSASVGRESHVLLDHGELSADKVNNHQVSSSIQLACEGEKADFSLKWFEGESAGLKKTLNIKPGLQTELSVEGVSENGIVHVPKNSRVKIDIKSTLKTMGGVEAGFFSASQILVINVL